MTLSLAISKNAEEICSQNSVEELMISPPATAIKDLLPPSISTENKLALSLPSLEKLHDDTPACSVQRKKTSKNKSAKPRKDKAKKDKNPSPSEILF